MPAYPKLKLVYFNAAGRAESVRLAFAIGDVPFEDERISHAEFSARKASLPYGQTPVLEVDGQVLAQSQAILRYAGRLANLYPANDAVAALKVDEILSVFDELQDKMGPSFREQDPEKKKALREELATSILPRYLTRIEARLVKMKQYPVFQAKDDVFIHEIVIFACVRFLQNGVLDHVPTNVTDGYVEINAAATKIREHQKVKEWYANPRNAVPKLKLTYFDLAGRGSPIRLALHIGGIEFEDERIDRAELEKRREAEILPFGQLPVLEVNGDVMAQSLAILRYVGSLTGLYPVNDAMLALRIDEILCLIDDFYSTMATTFRLEPEAQTAARQALLEGSFGSQLTAADKRVASWSAQYAVSADLTVADLALHGVVLGLKAGHISGIPTTWVDGFPHLIRIYDQVNESPKVQEYRQTKEF